MELLDADDLAERGVPGDIAGLLGPAPGIAGFQAGLYQDYITGEAQYVLAFAGTDDDVWAKEWDDWINNIDQAFGFAAEQYETAMLIGDALVQVDELSNGNLVATGHSLGGGLASAAAVVGGIPADTFNTAGLHVDTLYQRDVNDDPISDGLGGYVEIHTGSVARFNNASTFIDAYYSEYDILSAVQDNTAIPNALGHRIILDSPFDLEMATNAVLLGASIGSGFYWLSVFPSISGVAFMIESHFDHTLLYGLLTIEHWSGIGFELDVLGYDQYF